MFSDYSEDSGYQLKIIEQCISMGTRKHITTPIHYMYISDNLGTMYSNVYPELCKHAHSHLV